MTSSSSVVDLFCGAGGLSYGFKNQGFTVSAGVDIDENCRYPYVENIKASFVRTDVTEVTRAGLLGLFDPHKVKILVGCAPCQPFSKYNQKNSDPKWKLLESFGRLISAVNPDIVSMENVPQLIKFKEGVVFNAFIKTLKAAGYYYCFDTLFSPNYGLPQSRSRLVLLASLFGPISLPPPTHVGKYVTVRKVLSDMAPIAAGTVDDNDNLHCFSGLSDLNLERITRSSPGGSWQEWPAELVAKCHQKETGKNYRAVYGRTVANRRQIILLISYIAYSLV